MTPTDLACVESAVLVTPILPRCIRVNVSCSRLSLHVSDTPSCLCIMPWLRDGSMASQHAPSCFQHEGLWTRRLQHGRPWEPPTCRRGRSICGLIGSVRHGGRSVRGFGSCILDVRTHKNSSQHERNRQTHTRTRAGHREPSPNKTDPTQRHEHAHSTHTKPAASQPQQQHLDAITR